MPSATADDARPAGPSHPASTPADGQQPGAPRGLHQEYRSRIGRVHPPVSATTRTRYTDGKARKSDVATSPITRASRKKKVVAARFIHNGRRSSSVEPGQVGRVAGQVDGFLRGAAGSRPAMTHEMVMCSRLPCDDVRLVALRLE